MLIPGIILHCWVSWLTPSSPWDVLIKIAALLLFSLSGSLLLAAIPYRSYYYDNLLIFQDKSMLEDEDLLNSVPVIDLDTMAHRFLAFLALGTAIIVV